MADAAGVLTQEKYGELVHSLDDVMTTMKLTGKTEAEAQAWLKDFIHGHYLPVWRKIAR